MEQEKKNRQAPERRNYSFEVRAKEDDKGKYIEGYPIVFEEKTDICGLWEETIQRGALDGANLKDVRFLVNHDTNKIPLARSRNNNENSTMQLKVDERGLHIRVNLDVENNVEARALYSAVNRGDLTGMSFLFDVKKETWEEERSNYPKRHIEKLDTVYEVSAVTFPAYEGTEIYARNKEALENAKKTLESVRKRSENPLDSGENTGENPPDGGNNSGETNELELLKEKNRILGGI